MGGTASSSSHVSGEARLYGLLFCDTQLGKGGSGEFDDSEAALVSVSGACSFKCI